MIGSIYKIIWNIDRSLVIKTKLKIYKTIGTQLRILKLYGLNLKMNKAIGTNK